MLTSMENTNQFTDETSDLQEVKIDTSCEVSTTPVSWKSPYNTECPCCLEIPKQGRVILDCRHLLCVSCFVKHVGNSKECPVCRKEFHNLVLPRRNARLSTIGQNLINNEINRRLQNHINAINNIRQNLPTRNQLRYAAPLRAQRISHHNNNDIIDLNEDDIIPVSSRQYIIITVFTIIDILIMLLWLHAINSKHKLNN